MSPKVERSIYIVVIAILAVYLLILGKKQIELQKNIPITAEELYKKLSNPKLKVQIVDVRELTSSDEVGGYEDSRIPGALPFPNCDESKMNTENLKDALQRINPYIYTVIVSTDGNPEIFKKCAQKFNNAQNLAGGMKAWQAAGLPDESGEYTPPKAGGGGGCL
ncbi:MAG: rhodanese-like domain-containing protein [Hydrogenothermaceae bacterium]|nr:rhodanese-like domain-containing protein [Hydrogenothermaceae bacterium]